MRASIIAYALRAVGLEILNSIARRYTGRRKVEEPKVVLHKSFWIALSRALVHLLPLSVLAALVYINYNTLYIGPSFQWTGQTDEVFLAIIQVAAKAQELLCVASLAAIVLQALRQELLHEGLPIGLLGSGIWFSQISSFWSPEFLAAVPWSTKSARRFQLYLLLIAAGLIAAVIGPASAVLMLPRNQEIPAGRTSFYLNGTADEIWPGTVTAASEPTVCTFSNSTEYPVCPSGGYKSLFRTFETLNLNQSYYCGRDGGIVGQQFAPQCQAKGITGWRYWKNFLIQSSQNLLPPVLSSFLPSTGVNRQTVVLQPHAATVASMQQLVHAWSQMVDRSTKSPWKQYRWSYGLVASGSATNPWARVACSDGQNLSIDASQAGFPYLQPFDEYPGTAFGPGHRLSDVSKLNRSVSDRIRAQWTSLEVGMFGDAEFGVHSTGLLVELPWTGESRVAFGCAVVASWHNNTITSDRTANYDAWSAVITGMEYTWHYPGLVESPEASQTNKPIALDQSWLELLTPSVPSISEDRTTRMNTLEQILTSVGIQDVVTRLREYPSMHWDHSTNRCVYGMRDPRETDTQLWNANDCGGGSRDYVQLIIGSVVVDGLSRFGSHHVYDSVDGEPRDWVLNMPQTFNSSLLLKNLRQSSTNLASQWLSISVTGWAFYASNTTDYLALAVVCAYIVLASTHVLWLLYWKHWISSGAWDTVTELLVLCKNSPPSVPSRLENASAGLHRLGTFGTIVKVRVANPTSEMTENNESIAVGKPKSAKVILVEEPPMESQDEMKLALLGTVACSTVAAPASDPNLRRRAGLLETVEVNATYG